MKRIVSTIVFAVLLMLSAVLLIPAELAYADVLNDLGFSTSSDDLENFDQRAESQPYGNKNITFHPVVEEYMVQIGSDSEDDPATLERFLKGDNDFGDWDDTIRSDSLPVNNIKYVKTAAVDLNDQGKKHAVAELYYREANNGEIYLTIVDAGGEVEWEQDDTINPVNLKGAATNEILVFSNTGAEEPLITNYKNQHTYLNLVAGDFDNDGISEIAVYVPDADDPHIALYRIENGEIQATPVETFHLPALSKFVYLTCGDITGDNLDDLVVSYNGVYNVPKGDDPDNTGHVYIFKSQDFSLARPHVFNSLGSSKYNGKNYYTSRIPNASVAIGKAVEGSKSDKWQLVVGGSRHTAESLFRYYSWSILEYQYNATTGQWDFRELGRVDDNTGSAIGFCMANLNELTTLACVKLWRGNNCDIYLDGYLATQGDDIYHTSGDYSGPLYIDYEVVNGNFDGNSDNTEQLKMIREKFHYDNLADRWESEGLEIATLNWDNRKVCRGVPLSDNITCAGLAAPNTDDDTVIIKYKGHDLQYSYPRILAALASPPYFEDLAHLEGGDNYIGSSSTEISSGEGSSAETHGSVTVTAGGYFSFEKEVSFFGARVTKAELEIELTSSYTWDTSHETEVSTSISYGTLGGQDSVAVYTIPMDVFMYEVWAPGVGGKGGTWQPMTQCFPYQAAYVVIPLEKYNGIAAREQGLPQISGKLFTHTLGKPETYPTSSEKMYKVKDPITSDQFTSVGYGDAYTSQSIEVTEAKTVSHTYSGSLTTRGGAGGGSKILGVIIGLDGGGGTSKTSINNVGYTGTIANMPLDAESYGYNYQWQLVAYPYLGELQQFPVIHYAVQQVRRPPLLPQNFEMQSSTENSITLTWDNVDPNVTGYQLYRYYSFEGALADYYKIGDVIPVGTTSFVDTDLQPYTYYKYKIQSIGGPYGGRQTESILGPECMARTNPVSDAPVIVQQPRSVEAAAGSSAVFQVIAQPAPNASAADRIFYQWQCYEDCKWTVVADATNNLFSINSVKEEDAGEYRCAVSQYVGPSPVTIYSEPVTLTVNKNNLKVKLEICDSSGQQVDKGDIGAELVLKAQLEGADREVPPTGRINFLLIYYPDPEEIETEEGEMQIVYPDPICSIRERPIIVKTLIEDDWVPAGYGSYDIVAVYLGDDNYHKSTSSTGSFTCAQSTSTGISGLRITGIENNTLTYGDEINLGATVWQNGQLRTLMVDEVEFVSSDGEGLIVGKTTGSNPEWYLTAKRAGSYTLIAETTNTPKLRVTKNITVNKVQIGLKAKDQQLFQGQAPDSFTLELIGGELRLQDSLDNTFGVQYRCTANETTPPGVYDIFIDSLTQTANDYEILSVNNGVVIVDGPKHNIKFHGVSNGKVLAQINNWRVLEQNYTTGYDIAVGSYVRFSAIPDTGYRIEKWVINGTEVKKDDGSYDTSAYITTSRLSLDVAIKVYFVPDLCELTFSAGDNGKLVAQVGSISVGSGAVLPSQTVVSFTAIPDEGYMVDHWTVNNTTLSGNVRNSCHQTITQDVDVKVFFAPVEYVAVNYTAVGNGQVTAENPDGTAVEKDGLVIKGSDVVFTATPNDANTMIKEWVVNGQVVQGNSLVYIVENIRNVLQVEVVFIDAITYKVNFGAIGYGTEALTAEVDGVAIKSGDRIRGYSEVVFTANTPKGYRVKQWKLGSAVIQDKDGLPLLSETFILEELKSSVTVTVEFESTNIYYVDYGVIDTLPDEDGGENGTLIAQIIYGGVSSEYLSGDEIIQGSKVVLTAVPDAGYTIAGWTVDGSDDATIGAVYTFDSIQANHEITVEFVAGSNPLTFAAIGNGTVTAVLGDEDVSSGDEIADGTEVTFSAVPEDGYQVKEWRYNGEKVADSTESYTLEVNNGGYVEAEFERVYYTLTLGENLTANIEGVDLQGASVQGGRTVTVIASPPVGYLLTGWYMDRVLLEDEQGDSYSFIMEQDTEITADFALQDYTVTFITGDNGTITATVGESEISSGSNQLAGCSVVFTARPAEGYQVQKWYRDYAEVSGQKVTGSKVETYSIDELGKAEYIQVFFEEISDEPIVEEYVVSFSAGSGGGLSARVDGQVISSGDTVVKGKMVVFTATADTGKTVDGWSGVENGSLSANQLTFIIDNLSAAANVYVTFKNSSTGGGGGSGGGSAPQVVNPSGEGVASPSTGGQISLGDEASITVPPLALQGNAEVNVAINRVTSSPDKPSGFMVLGQVFEFTVGGHNSYRFNKPVTLEFAFDPEDVPQGTKPSVYYYDASTSKWIELGGKVSGNSILITTDHFTLFAVMCKTEAAAIPQPITPLLSDLGQHWAKATIELLVGQGIISGYPDGTFKPNQTITRAEFVALLVRALKLEPTGSGKIFGDTTDHWARDTIAIAGSYGIVSGYDENTFGPNNPITREQMAVMAVKAIKLTSVSSVSEEIKFIDNRQISSWAKSSVSAAVKKRIMVGYPDNSFKPQGTATRAEAASVIHNLIR